jgi:hypothetical protein
MSFFKNLSVGEYARVEAWLKKYGVKNYTINADLTVDVDGNVDLNNQDFEEFGVQFGKVSGSFDCNGCKNLKTLKCAPKEVSGSFNCYSCTSLTSLEGAPEKVGREFSCIGCTSLTSLEGAPEKVNGGFYCSGCKVKFTEEDVKKVCKVRGIIYV